MLRKVKSHKTNIFEILGRGSIHPFPARMAPGIAMEALEKSTSPLRVLDPMAGSGTVLAIARKMGHYAYGLDLDPLAVLLSKTWTTKMDSVSAINCAVRVLARAENISSRLRLRDAYPEESDEETRKFLRYWFDGDARRQLCSLSISISQVQDQTIKNALWCAFSRLIITKQSGVSLAMDLSHSRPHKVFNFAPVRPFDKFLDAARVVTSNCIQGTGKDGPASVVKLGDARKMPFDSESFDFALTSPPYLNAIDYIRCSKYSLVWMGYSVADLRVLRGESVGAEKMLEESADDKSVRQILKDLRLTPKLSSRNEGMLARYIFDMIAATKEVSRVLKGNGRAIYVVGDSSLRGTFIRNSQVVVRAAELNGLKLKKQNWRLLPQNRRYLPPPLLHCAGEALNARMSKEIILSFIKAA